MLSTSYFLTLFFQTLQLWRELCYGVFTTYYFSLPYYLYLQCIHLFLLLLHAKLCRSDRALWKNYEEYRKV